MQIYDSTMGFSEVVGMVPNPMYKHYIWDKKTNPEMPKQIDLKDFFNFFGCQTLEDAAKISKVDPKIQEEYKTLAFMLKKIVLSFGSFDFDSSKYKINQIIPSSILEDFIFAKRDVIAACAEWFEKFPNSEKIQKFFLEQSKTNILRKMNYNIITLEGIEKVDLLFGANFRFKSEKETLNIFNMPVSERKKIIPQKEDHVIYAADFRQFEFRTYLMLHKNIIADLEELELYKQFGEKLNLNEQDVKVSIISYLYGKENELIDSELKKSELLNLIHDNFFLWRGYPVVFSASEPNYKRIHTLVQTLSQYVMLEKLEKVLDLCDGEDIIFIYPFHDEVILSVKKDKLNWVSDKIKFILEDEIYKIRHYFGLNLKDLEEINGK